MEPNVTVPIWLASPTRAAKEAVVPGWYVLPPTVVTSDPPLQDAVTRSVLPLEPVKVPDALDVPAVAEPEKAYKESA